MRQIEVGGGSDRTRREWGVQEAEKKKRKRRKKEK